MGCDIHLRVQARDDQGKWREVPDEELGPNWTYDSTYKNQPAHGRDYLLFARLANVRNHDGRMEPLFAERGVPEDHEVWREPPSDDPEEREEQELHQQEHPERDDWEHRPDYHSHTWATLAELRAADWGVDFQDEVTTSPSVYRRWRDDGELPGYSARVWSIDKEHDVMAEADYLAGERATTQAGRAEFSRRMLTDRALVTYCITYKPLERCGFVTWVRDGAMTALAERAGGPDNVRVLIAFDN